jgi:hypothetical protein
MKPLQDAWRFVTTTWFVAAPLLVLFVVLVVLPVVFMIMHAILVRMIGRDDADTMLMGAVMWTSEFVLVLGPLAFVIYVGYRVARRFFGKQE